MIADYLFRRPRILWLAIAVIFAVGISSWFVLPQLEDPVLSRRVGIISTVNPGANAQQVEAQVTIPLEESLRGLAKVKSVRSNSQQGSSNVVVELQDWVNDVDPVWSVVRDRIAETREQLPEEVRSSTLHVVPLKAYAAIIALHPAASNAAGQADDLAAIQSQADELRRRILAIGGTESAERYGVCLVYTSPSPRDRQKSRMPSSA